MRLLSIIGFVASVFIVGMFALVTISFSVDMTLKENRKALERAYFDGQTDYAEGDIRIAKESGSWVWSKSPWTDNRAVIYKH